MPTPDALDLAKRIQQRTTDSTGFGPPEFQMSATVAAEAIDRFAAQRGAELCERLEREFGIPKLILLGQANAGEITEADKAWANEIISKQTGGGDALWTSGDQSTLERYERELGWSEGPPYVEVRAAALWLLHRLKEHRAQSGADPNKAIVGLREAVAHARGEAPARYNCGHWHASPAEAQSCPQTGGGDDARSMTEAERTEMERATRETHAMYDELLGTGGGDAPLTMPEMEPACVITIELHAEEAEHRVVIYETLEALLGKMGVGLLSMTCAHTPRGGGDAERARDKIVEAACQFCVLNGTKKKVAHNELAAAVQLLFDAHLRDTASSATRQEDDAAGLGGGFGCSLPRPICPPRRLQSAELSGPTPTDGQRRCAPRARPVACAAR